MSDLDYYVSSPRSRLIWIIAAGVAAAVLLGLAATRLGPSIFALVVGPLLGLWLFVRPELGLYAIAFTLPIEDLIPGVGSVTGTRLLGMAVFGIWVLRKLIRRDSWLPLLKSPLILGAGALLSWSFASTLWAAHRSAALFGLLSQVQLIFLALIVIDMVQSWERADRIARLLVIGGLIAAGFTAEQYFVQGVKRAGDGISGGINFTASSLVSIMPFAFYLIRSRAKGLWLLLGLLYIPFGIVAVIVTFSRTSYILLAFVLLVHAWLLLRTESRRGWSLMLVILSLAVLIVAPREAINERLQSISPLVESWLETGASESAQADVRAFHWRMGMEMLKDSPLVGVGFSNYGEQFLIYQFEVQGTPDIYANPRSPHSSYIGITTELGIIGIGLYLFMLGTALHNLIRAGSRLRILGDTNNLYLSQAVYYVFMLQVLYGWALNTHLNKNFWLVLGLSVVLYRLASGPAAAMQERRLEPLAADAGLAPGDHRAGGGLDS